MQDQGPWGDCPSGVMTEMVARLRRRKRQSQLRPIILSGIALLLLSFVAYGLTSREESGSGRGLTCRETVPLLAKYHDRTLDATVASDVREHLSQCPACRKHYTELYPSEVRNRASTEHRLLAVAAQFRR